MTGKQKAVIAIAVTGWLAAVAIASPGLKRAYDRHQAQNQLEALCQDYGDAAKEVAEAWPGLVKAEDFQALFDQIRQVHPNVPEESLFTIFEYVYQVGKGRKVEQIQVAVKTACLKYYQTNAKEV